MRTAIALFILVAVAPIAASAQTTTITITNSACTNPPPPADVPAPITPSVAAGSAAARNRDFALARANFRPLAEKGDVEAQRALGQLLMQNCTGLQDKAMAVGWLTKAAGTGDVPAENQLARAYLLGFGVAQDDARAFTLYNQADAAGDDRHDLQPAEPHLPARPSRCQCQLPGLIQAPGMKVPATGNALAQAELGYLYLSGRGVAQDKYQGLQWSVKAGEQGNAIALSNIARAYLKGEVVARNSERAAYFLALATQRANLQQRIDMGATSQEIRQAVSVDDMNSASKSAQRWSPGPGSLRDVLSDAEDFRKHHS